MKKKIFLILIISVLTFENIYAARTCSSEFGIGDVVGNTNEYSLTSYPVPLQIKARSKVISIDQKVGNETQKQPTRIRRDMYFKVTQKPTVATTASNFEIMSVVSKSE